MLLDMLRNDNKCDGNMSLVNDDENKEREEEHEEVTPMLLNMLRNDIDYIIVNPISSS